MGKALEKFALTAVELGAGGIVAPGVAYSAYRGKKDKEEGKNNIGKATLAGAAALGLPVAGLAAATPGVSGKGKAVALATAAGVGALGSAGSYAAGRLLGKDKKKS